MPLGYLKVDAKLMETGTATSEAIATFLAKARIAGIAYPEGYLLYHLDHPDFILASNTEYTPIFKHEGDTCYIHSLIVGNTLHVTTVKEFTTADYATLKKDT